MRVSLVRPPGGRDLPIRPIFARPLGVDFLHGKVYPLSMKRGRRRVEWNGERVRALRGHLGMTQQEMAEELGTRQQTISEWETGMYRPRGASATLLSMVAERARFRYRAHPPEKATRKP